MTTTRRFVAVLLFSLAGPGAFAQTIGQTPSPKMLSGLSPQATMSLANC